MGEYGWKFSDRLPLNGVGWVNVDGSLVIDFLKLGGMGEYGWKFSDRLPLNGVGWVNVDDSLVILPLNGVG